MIEIAHFQIGASLQQPIHHRRVRGIMQGRLAISTAHLHDRLILLSSLLKPFQPALFRRGMNVTSAPRSIKAVREIARSTFQHLEIARPPLRLGVDIGAMPQQRIDHFQAVLGDDDSRRTKVKMRISRVSRNSGCAATTRRAFRHHGRRSTA